MYHWIETLNTLYINDASVMADHPFTNVFNQNGVNTYAACNFGTSPLDVAFSDGAKLIAKPGAITVQKANP